MTFDTSLRAAACAGVCCLSFSVAVLAQAPSSGGAAPAAATAGALSAADKKFVEDAAAGGMAEVELGRMAEQKASNAQVRQYGARMVQDHGKANAELQSLAAAKGASLPTALPAPHKSQADKMARLSGADFDRAYMKHMVDDHRATIAKFEKQSQTGADPDLKAWAGKTLPTLRDHLQQAQTAHASVNPGQ
jgi:putative membrane protein